MKTSDNFHSNKEPPPVKLFKYSEAEKTILLVGRLYPAKIWQPCDIVKAVWDKPPFDRYDLDESKHDVETLERLKNTKRDVIEYHFRKLVDKGDFVEAKRIEKKINIKCKSSKRWTEKERTIRFYRLAQQQADTHPILEPPKYTRALDQLNSCYEKFLTDIRFKEEGTNNLGATFTKEMQDIFIAAEDLYRRADAGLIEKDKEFEELVNESLGLLKDIKIVAYNLKKIYGNYSKTGALDGEETRLLERLSELLRTLFQRFNTKNKGGYDFYGLFAQK